MILYSITTGRLSNIFLGTLGFLSVFYVASKQQTVSAPRMILSAGFEPYKVDPCWEWNASHPLCRRFEQELCKVAVEHFICGRRKEASLFRSWCSQCNCSISDGDEGVLLSGGSCAMHFLFFFGPSVPTAPQNNGSISQQPDVLHKRCSGRSWRLDVTLSSLFLETQIH